MIKEAALRSGVSRGVMQAFWDAAGEVIKAWATTHASSNKHHLGTITKQLNYVVNVGLSLFFTKFRVCAGSQATIAKHNLYRHW